MLDLEWKLETGARRVDMHGCMLVVVVEGLMDPLIAMHDLGFAEKGRPGRLEALWILGKA